MSSTELLVMQSEGSKSTYTLQIHKIQILSFIDTINNWMFLSTDGKLWANPYYS